jgi:CheY-like chemotaxis protein
MNFVSNALKFTLEGQIDVVATLFNPIAATSHTHLNSTMPYLRLEVHDTGKGVPNHLRSRLFNRFAQLQSDAGGIGLGLFSVKSQCDVLGGSCGVHSRNDTLNGSLFWIDVPVHPCGSDCGMKTIASTPLARARKTEMDDGGVADQLDPPEPVKCAVADDVTLNLMLVCRLLRKMGFEPVAANDGLELLELLRGPSGKDFRFVLTDLHMPNCDGFTATKIYRKYEEEIKVTNRMPIFAITAARSDEISDKCFECGFDGVLFKPFTKQNLSRQLKSNFIPIPVDTEDDVPPPIALTENALL